jgi:hypothetical protein
MPSRTQITLTGDLQRRARQKAEALGISFAEYVRRLVAKDVGSSSKRPPVSAIFDLGKSAETTDVARDKGRMLADAIQNSRRRK